MENEDTYAYIKQRLYLFTNDRRRADEMLDLILKYGDRRYKKGLADGVEGMKYLIPVSKIPDDDEWLEER